MATEPLQVVMAPGPSPSARPLRVLTVIDALHLAGAEKLVVTLARYGPAAGFTLDVVSLSDPSRLDGRSVAPQLVDAGARVTSVDARRLLDLGATVRLVRLIRDLQPDVVHAHLQYAVTSTPAAARLAGRPVVCSFHHVPGEVTRREAVKERLAVLAADRSDAVVTVSHAQRRAFVERHPIRRPGAWHVVPNGIDTSPFAAAAGGRLPEDLAARVPSGPVVALVARLRDGKGHRLLLDAWRDIVRTVPEAHLLLVGDGPLATQLRDQVTGSGLSRHVTFTGARIDVPVILGAVDLVVLPSETEAQPTVLMEAAAAGAAVVATDVGGVREVVTPGRTGVVIAPGDRDALRDAILELLNDDVARYRLGANATRTASRFGVSAWTARLAALYQDVLSSRDLAP